MKLAPICFDRGLGGDLKVGVEEVVEVSRGRSGESQTAWVMLDQSKGIMLAV